MPTGVITDMLPTPQSQAPLVVHLLYRLDFGGLESLVVDCVNRIGPEHYRHVIVCLTDFTDFAQKITQPNVEIFSLHKPPGLAPGIHFKLWALLRQLKPAILHTYNLAAIEYGFTAKLAGVPICIHAEHGRDMSDMQGTNVRHNFLRRQLRYFIDHYVAVSADLHQWLHDTVQIPSSQQCLIINGVDTEKFKPQGTPATLPWSAAEDGLFVIGTVGQIRDIKNHRGLISAFQQLVKQYPQYRARLRLCIIGAGTLLPQLEQQVANANLGELVWLPGARSDIAPLMSAFSVFTLPSLAEGTPVALLEAMASGLPVVASNVGGIPETISDQVHGTLVPVNDQSALVAALVRYLEQPELGVQHGLAARVRIEQQYSLTSMINGYTALYDLLCQKKIKKSPGRASRCVE